MLEPAASGRFDLLSPEECARSNRFAFEHLRRRYRAARSALRVLLAAHLGVSARDIRFIEGAQGKPYVEGAPDCAFNLSHSDDFAVVAIAPQPTQDEVGVDVEIVRPMRDALALAKSNYTAAEREPLTLLEGQARDTEFLRIWTRKEACLKALGSGLSVAPERFEAGAGTARRLTRIAFEGRVREMEVESVEVGATAVAAVARMKSAAVPGA